MSAQIAKRCFGENVRLFGDSATQPEKFNLYNGLANLAAAIQDIEKELDQIKREVHTIKNNMR